MNGLKLNEWLTAATIQFGQKKMCQCNSAVRSEVQYPDVFVRLQNCYVKYHVIIFSVTTVVFYVIKIKQLKTTFSII